MSNRQDRPLAKKLLHALGPVSYTHLDVYKRQLLGAATRVKNLMDLKHREPVVLHIDGESCYITSRLTGVEFHEDVLCQGTIPEPMNIAFDDILLLNGISATKGEGIRALLNSSLSPMKIENEGFTALVLPVRMKMCIRDSVCTQLRLSV